MAQSNGARIALHCPLDDEMAPGARMRCLLNPPSLDGVLLLEGSGFDGLAELELLEETSSVRARYG
jgi:hypothetical protein